MAKIKIEELKKDLDRYVDYDIDLSLINDYNQGYIQDIVNEIGDNQVSIYTSDLLDWANDSEHVEAIDNAMSELGTPNDFIEIIRQGQCYYYMNIYNENIEELTKYYYLTIFERREVEEIEEDLFEEVNFREFDTLEEVEEKALEDIERNKKMGIVDSIVFNLNDNLLDTRNIELTKKGIATIEEFEDKEDMLLDLYERIANKFECSKNSTIEFVRFYLLSDLYKINIEDFKIMFEDYWKELEEERKNQNIEFLGE